MNDFIKNICLITFALIGPIALPAGGSQRNLVENKFLNNSKEIILHSNYSLHPFPKTNSKKLIVLHPGTSLSVLSQWKINERDIWVRVKLATNPFIDHPNKIHRGWIKI